MLSAIRDRLGFGAPAVIAAVLVGCIVAWLPILALWIAGITSAVLAISGPLRNRAGFVVGSLVVAYVNGIPFINLYDVRIPGGALARDVALMALLVAGVYLWVRKKSAYGWATVSLVRVLGAFVLVWVLSVLNAALTVGTIWGAVLYGRDVLALLIALPVALVCLDVRQARIFGSVLVGAAVLHSVGLILLAAGGVDSGLVHATKVSFSEGLPRAYTHMEYLASAALLLAVGWRLYQDGASARIVNSVVVAVLALGLLVSMVRANYLAMTIGLIFGGVLHLARSRDRLQIDKVALGGLGLAAAVVIGRLAEVRIAGSILEPIVARIESITQVFISGGDTYGYRLSLYESMLDILGRSWLAGLGFVHPADYWFPTLVAGSLRNNDVGILSILMTQGALGLLAMGGVLWVSVKAGLTLLGSEDRFAFATGWCVLAYMVVVLTSAFSLMYLSGAQGLAASAAIIGMAVGLCDHFAATND